MDRLKVLAGVAVTAVAVMVPGSTVLLVVGIATSLSVATVAAVLLVAALVVVAVRTGVRGSGWVETPYWRTFSVLDKRADRSCRARCW